MICCQDHEPLERFLFPQATAKWASGVTQKLIATSEAGIASVPQVLPATVVQRILEAVCNLAVKEPTVVDVSCKHLALSTSTRSTAMVCLFV